MLSTSPRDDTWPYSAVLAGFVGTVAAGLALLVGYTVALGLAQTTPGQLGAWFANLTQNTTTRIVTEQLSLALLMHFGVGIALAVVYAALVEPRLTGPGWLRGMLFAVLPWVLSLVLFLPLAGGGFLGLDLGAGPLPMLGNLVLHLIYGGSLGWVYARAAAEHAETDVASLRANEGAERGVAIGVVGGALLGTVLGYTTGGFWEGGSPLLASLVGATMGATMGGFLGSFVGVTAGRA